MDNNILVSIFFNPIFTAILYLKLLDIQRSIAYLKIGYVQYIDTRAIVVYMTAQLFSGMIINS